MKYKLKLEPHIYRLPKLTVVSLFFVIVTKATKTIIQIIINNKLTDFI